MSIETLTPQDPSRESYVTAARRQVTKNALTSLAQHWTWPESLFPRQDIPTSQETTLKTLQDDETVAKELSNRLPSSSLNASKGSKKQDFCQPHIDSNLSTITFNNQKLAEEVSKPAAQVVPGQFIKCLIK
jgi:hypothetical protein